MSWLPNPQWLTVVRQLPCRVCKRWPCDAHHVGNGGMSRKDADIRTIPLCHEHHMSHHNSANPPAARCWMWLRHLWEDMTGSQMLVNPIDDDQARHMDGLVRTMMSGRHVEHVILATRKALRDSCGMCGYPLQMLCGPERGCPNCEAVFPW